MPLCCINENNFTGTYILLDTVQDPGNVGTIIRSAHAFGICGVILTEGCADIYNPKSIRASMGAIFKQRIFNLDLNKINALKNKGLRFICASNDKNAIEYDKTDLKNTIIIIGNEGQGIKDEFHEICDEIVKIPVVDDCESLNAAVAASILMREIYKGDY